MILLRRGGRHGGRALEVLLVKRNPEARFMPGVWVFPGGALDLGDGGEHDDDRLRFCARRELAEEAGIELPADAELIPYSRWITPEAVPLRFDARFYLALAPAHCTPQPDGAETVDAGWFTPARALELGAAGEIELVFPTIKHLESLSAYATADDAVESIRGATVEPVLPRIVGDGEERRVVLPGDPGFEDE